MTADKTDATRVACAALAGFELHRLDDGRWLVIRWNLQRVLADDAAVDLFLQQIGAPA